MTYEGSSSDHGPGSSEIMLLVAEDQLENQAGDLWARKLPAGVCFYHVQGARTLYPVFDIKGTS